MTTYNELREIQHNKVKKYLQDNYPHILDEFDYDTEIELCENGDVHINLFTVICTNITIV